MQTRLSFGGAEAASRKPKLGPLSKLSPEMCYHTTGFTKQRPPARKLCGETNRTAPYAPLHTQDELQLPHVISLWNSTQPTATKQVQPAHRSITKVSSPPRALLGVASSETCLGCRATPFCEAPQHHCNAAMELCKGKRHASSR